LPIAGEPRVCSIVHLPSVEDEDRKRRTPERNRPIEECTAHSNRIKGLLHGLGIREVKPLDRAFVNSLAGLRTGDVVHCRTGLRKIAREYERLCLVVRQLEEFEAAVSRASAKPATGAPVSSRSNWCGYGRFISPTAH
jgi:transposase